MAMITLLIERENRLLGEAGGVETVVEGIRMHGNNKFRVGWRGCYGLSFLEDNGCSTRFAYKELVKKTVVILLNDISYEFVSQMEEDCKMASWLKQS